MISGEATPFGKRASGAEDRTFPAPSDQSTKSIQSPTGELISRAFVVFLIQRDVKIITAAEFSSSLGEQGKECFLPATVQV